MSGSEPEFRTIDELDPGRRLLVRVDLNSPVKDGDVRDNRRFDRHAGTIAELVDADHRIAVLAHQGRPGGDDFVSLDQHADILATHLDRPVSHVPETYGQRAVEAIRALDPGDVLVLENVRMVNDELADRTPEEHAESEFVRSLAPEFDAYVDDAFSAAHRAQASLVGFPLVLPAYAGPVMEAEYAATTAIRDRAFDGPVTAVLGGTKVDDLLHVMDQLGDWFDAVLLGSVPGELFLRADGHDVGYDIEGTELFDDLWASERDAIERLADRYGDRIHRPVDLAYEDDDGERAEITVEDAEKRRPFLDIGAVTTEAYAETIAKSGVTILKGPPGVFEDERFAAGTLGVLEAMAESDGESILGGGDTSRVLDVYGFDEADYDHVTIAGGAFVRGLTGDSLPAVEVLDGSR